jgi:hypothetical protein
MTERALFYPRGTVLLMSSGEYSDYAYVGQLVTIKDCDLPKLAQECRDTFKKEEGGWRDEADANDFPSWLVANGYAVPLECSEVHVGSYGRWSRELGGDE